MAISNLKLNVTANTARALADFNKFSRSLDNKFLISGLKLDVVRSSLNQITQEFQRAIGEQGLASASSFRAAQNQAAMLTQTFKGFAAESALSITENIGTALNSVVVRAGGTMKDVQKTLAATPFISTTIGDDLRDKLTKGILAAQVNMRRAGLGDNFGEVATQFLRGRVTGMQLTESGGGAEAFLGAEILKRTGGEGRIYSPQERSKVLEEILNDPEIQKQLNMMAKRSAGFKIILEDLNTKLFNPEFGVFGSLRKIVDASGKTTTMFDEVERLIGQVFGPNGMFATLVKSIQSVFGQGDLIRPLIDLVQFTTRTFKGITEFLNSPGFKGILRTVKEVFSGISDTFKDIYDQVSSSNFTTDDIVPMIMDIGTAVRDYIQNIGRFIRDLDDDEAIGLVSDIAGTLLSEVGKTAVVMIKELFSTLIDKLPTLITTVLPAINNGINSILTEVFGEVGAKIVKFVLGFVPGPVGAIARASAVGDITGGGGSMGSALLMGAGAIFGPAMLARTLTARGRISTMKSLRGRAGNIEDDINTALFLKDSMGRNRFTPITQGVVNPLRYGVRGVNELQRSALSSVIPASRSLASSAGSLGSRAMSGARGIPGSVIQSLDDAMIDFVGSIRQRLPSRMRRNMADLRTRMRMSGSSYQAWGTRDWKTPIGPLPLNSAEPWEYVGSGQGYMGGDYDPYMGSKTHRFEGFNGSRYSTEDIFDRRDRMRRSGALRRMGFGPKLPKFPRIGKLGKAGLILGGLGAVGGILGLFGGSDGKAATMEGKGYEGPDLSGVGSVLGGGFEGAMTGAAIGSVIPVVGTAAGAAIGGVIGGILPLMDKGTKDSVSRFVSGVKKWFDDLLAGVANTISENASKFKDYFGGGLRNLASGILWVANGILSTLQVLPKMVMSVVNDIYSKVPKNSFLDGIIAGGNALANFQIPNPLYGGKNVSGVAMDLERKMSGNTPMIVNDSEFVIPKGGMPVLSDAVARKLSSQSAGNSGGAVQVQVNLSLTTHSFVANADELVKALKDPVYEIIGAAWTEATTANRMYRPT